MEKWSIAYGSCGADEVWFEILPSMTLRKSRFFTSQKYPKILLAKKDFLAISLIILWKTSTSDRIQMRDLKLF
jgi:hypothetical protein